MVPRAIVREADDFAGRWRFDGTTIFIDELHRDYRRNGEAIRLPYQKLGLSHEEIDAALAFVFPDVQSPSMSIQFVGLTVDCACGIHRQTSVSAPTFMTDRCTCGRTWRVPLEQIVPTLAEFKPGVMTGDSS
jgi:hypothetical protein